MTDVPPAAASARERFAALVRRGDAPLGEGCFTIGEHLGHPVDRSAGEAELDRLAQGVAPTLDAVAERLFGSLGFAGDADHYRAARNALLGDVLRRRRGIPITLAIVVIEVAERCGVRATGVGMPGHFLVGDGVAPRRWLDGFAGGVWLDEAAARRRFSELHGPEASWDPAFLRPTQRPQILARVLANLATTYRSLGDPTALLRTLELRSDVPGIGDAPRPQVELAEAYAAVGRLADAIVVLEPLVDRLEPRRRAAVEERIRVLRTGLS